MKLTRIVVALLIALLGVSLVSAQDAELGSEENPIQVYFVPSVEAQTLIEGGEVLSDALTEATGLNFEVSVPTSYAATVEAMCADPGRSMGFIPAGGYVIGNERCGLEVEAAAVRFGWPVYWAQYIVQRDSDIYVLGDLEGKSWAYPDRGSTSGFIVPSVELQLAGITPGDEVEAGGHPQAALAVYNGEVDFATTYFSPPLTPNASWRVGDLPEPYSLTVDEPFVNDEGDLFVGDVRILDARDAVAETAPDIIEQVRILQISEAIPNDTMSFGAEFPQELRDQIREAIATFAEENEEAWENSALGSDDGYNWSTLSEIDDSAYDPIRDQFEILGLTEEDVFEGN